MLYLGRRSPKRVICEHSSIRINVPVSRNPQHPLHRHEPLTYVFHSPLILSYRLMRMWNFLERRTQL
jgi:hypothetical protein